MTLGKQTNTKRQLNSLYVFFISFFGVLARDRSEMLADDRVEVSPLEDGAVTNKTKVPTRYYKPVSDSAVPSPLADGHSTETHSCCWRQWFHRYICSPEALHPSQLFLLGSAVCRAALARGIQVTSVRHVHISQSRRADAMALQLLRITVSNGERTLASLGIKGVLSSFLLNRLVIIEGQCI
jgi:hypothetical protein